jgi:hypothetical protein
VIDETSVQQIDFTAFRAYRSDSDTGGQKYRIGREEVGEQATFRDASWATVSVFVYFLPYLLILKAPQITFQYTQYEDKDRHTNRPVARWVQVQRWG